MVKNSLFVILSFLLFPAFSQNVHWSNDSSSTDNAIYPTNSVLTSKYLFVAGEFLGTSNFSNGESYKIYGSNPNFRDIFLSKYTVSGEIIKTIRIGSAKMDKIYSLKEKDGAIYMAGIFVGDCSFTDSDPTPLVNTGKSDGFVVKFNQNLEPLWKEALVYDSEKQRITDIDFDSDGNLIIIGDFVNSITFNHSISPVTVTPTTYLGKTVYIAKFDPNGEYISHKIFEGTSTGATAVNWLTKLVIDEDSYYVIGRYKNDVYIDGNQLISSGLVGKEDGYLLRMAYDFTTIWYREHKGEEDERLYNLEIDDNSDLYISGTFSSLDFVTDSTSTLPTVISPTVNIQDILIQKFSKTGNLLWHKYTSSASGDIVNFSNTNKNLLYLSGSYSSNLLYDGTVISNDKLNKDALFMGVSKLDGSLEVYHTIGAEGIDEGYTVNIDKSGFNNQYYLSVNYTSDTIFLDQDTIVNSNVVSNKTDMFVARFGCRDDIFPQFNLDSISCQGGGDGSITVSMTDGTAILPGIWTYLWEDASTNNNISGLVEGDYSVTITSDQNCAYTSSVFITNKMLVSQLDDLLTIECGVDSLLSVIVNVYSGTRPYIYQWSHEIGSFVDSIAYKLPKGKHYVTVTDACGTEIIDSIQVEYTLRAKISTHNTIIACEKGSDGEAWVSIDRENTDNGQPVTYTWENSVSTGNIASDLSIGLHHVTITDGCTEIVDSVNVVNLPSMKAEITSHTDVNCKGLLDGTANLFVTGGVEPYTYLWSNTEIIANPVNLPEGTATVTVTDACRSVIKSVEINTLPIFTLSLSQNSNMCHGDSTGTIKAVTNLGVSPYTFDWGSSSDLDTNYIDTLKAGWHYVTVSDQCNVLQVDSVKLTETLALEIYLLPQFVILNCSGDATGKSSVNVVGGKSPYLYLWSNGSTTPLVDNLKVGYTKISVSDACVDNLVDSVFVSYMPAISYSEIIQNPLCFKDKNGSLKIEISGGIHPYVIDWEDFDNDELIQQNLSAGEYKFTVTDICGETEGSIILDSPDSLYVLGNVTEATASNLSDGSIITEVYGGVFPYQYYWNNGETYADLINISEGNFIIKVTDFNNCSVIDSFMVASKTTIIEAMEAFTPNGDGVNETWTIKNIEKFPEAEIKIFNQWGNLVFESTGYDEPWDGTNNGRELSAAVYYYVIDLKDESGQKSGAITLLR